MNGYAEMHDLTLKVRADTLESGAGMTDSDVEMELGFALGLTDKNDPNALRWLAMLCMERINRLEGI